MAQSLIQIQSILYQHEFDFHNLPERLKCVICHKILKSAKQTTCGCKVCEKCINNYLSDSPKPCPSKQPDCTDVILNLKNDINQDNATNKEISNLKVKCPFTLCKYENQLKNMVAHIDNCEFREICCDKCGEKLEKKGFTTIQTLNTRIIFRNGGFIWKFTDFEVRRADAESARRVSITSDPFYTSEFGYKMCLRIYPAGWGIGEGTHLSVFFLIMKGEFDDLLSWPFKEKVTLSILDMEAGTSLHSVMLSPNRECACYQKPKYECNIASGWSKFILLSLLDHNSFYCKNDHIYLKLDVEPMTIAKPQK